MVKTPRKVYSKLMFAEYAISLEPVVKEKYEEKISLIGIKADADEIKIEFNIAIT